MSQIQVDAMLTSAETGRRLGVGRACLTRMVKEDGLPHYKINPKLFRFRWDEVQKWLDERRSK